jgi:hypothetical protein
LVKAKRQTKIEFAEDEDKENMIVSPSQKNAKKK